MSAPPKTPVPALPSATILLARDGARGLEVFMVQRHHRIDFATGAMVFPGGKVDPGDSDPALAGRCRGGAPEEALRAVHVAAIRETFEECGVLLAGPRGGDALVDAERLRALESRWREPLRADQTDMARMAREEDLELATDRLVPFAHWITPEPMKKRFDTHFFLAAAPADQVALHDGSESVDSAWVRPEDAEEDRRRGRRTIIFPTLLNLRKLGRSHSVAEALAAARAAPVVPVLPRIERGESGPRIRIPAEAGYDLTEAPVEDLMR